MLLAPTDEIQVADLPPALGGATKIIEEDLYGPFGTLAQGIAAFERYFLRRALREAKGDVEVAAGRAGVSPATLRDRIG
jgi:DNA-binding NtrC family response regulator